MAYVLFAADGAIADALAPAEQSGWAGAAGAGVMSFSTYTGGTGTRSQMLPLVSANYKEIFYVDPLRAALFLAGSADKKIGFGLAVEPRIGFQSSDNCGGAHSSSAEQFIGLEDYGAGITNCTAYFRINRRRGE